jgi:hypothetical protein
MICLPANNIFAVFMNESGLESLCPIQFWCIRDDALDNNENATIGVTLDDIQRGWPGVNCRKALTQCPDFVAYQVGPDMTPLNRELAKKVMEGLRKYRSLPKRRN